MYARYGSISCSSAFHLTCSDYAKSGPDVAIKTARLLGVSLRSRHVLWYAPECNIDHLRKFRYSEDLLSCWLRLLDFRS